MRLSLHRKLLAVAVPALVALASDSPAAAPAPIVAALPPGVSFADVPIPEHAEDVADYTLTAKLDPALHTIHGEGTIRWRNTSTAPVKELWLHLYLNAFKNQESVFLREPVGFRSGAQIQDWGYIDVRKLALHESDPVRGAPVDLWPNAELHRPEDGSPLRNARRDRAKVEGRLWLAKWRSHRPDRGPSPVDHRHHEHHARGHLLKSLLRGTPPSGHWG